MPWGDLLTPTFFPLWQQGEALTSERSISLGLEVDGVAQSYVCCSANAVVAAAPHLTAAEAACFPCAGVTAWSALELAAIAQQSSSWVLVQGTGGVATLGLLLAKSMGARVIVISGSDERLEQAQALGADASINYRSEPQWGNIAREISGHGVDLVMETGGTGTMPQSLDAIRHGGHIAVIGYMDGIELGANGVPTDHQKRPPARTGRRTPPSTAGDDGFCRRTPDSAGHPPALCLRSSRRSDASPG